MLLLSAGPFGGGLNAAATTATVSVHTALTAHHFGRTLFSFVVVR